MFLWTFSCLLMFFFFFNDTATTEIYTYGHTLSLHDALPILTSTISTQPPRVESTGYEPMASRRRRAAATMSLSWYSISSQVRVFSPQDRKSTRLNSSH